MPARPNAGLLEQFSAFGPSRRMLRQDTLFRGNLLCVNGGTCLKRISPL